MGPRHPGHRDLAPSAALAAARRRRRRSAAVRSAPARARRRRPPRPARTLLDGRPQHGAACTPRGLVASRPVAPASAARAARVIASAIAVERLGAVAPVLDDVLPPALGVVVPGGLGERRPSGSTDAAPSARPAGRARIAEHWMRGRQVEEPHRYAVRRPPSGSPATPGENTANGQNDGPPRVVGARRRAARPAAPARRRPRARRSASASGGPSIRTTSGCSSVERGAHRPGRPGPVVADRRAVRRSPG